MSASYETFGKYVLLEKLATGGMAEVFLARGIGAGGIGKFFAIKRILPQYADSPEFIEMFKDEAKIAINLSHSNIVSIHEFGVEKGQFFLVMDYVEGRNLRQILNKMKKTGLQFSVDQIVYQIKEVAAGLDHAHRCIDGSTGKPLNITHRDMSPQNVMVSFEGEVKVVDFGIAKAESQIETTRAGTLKGKFGYMSPEQAEGQPVDLRTDIFSLGIVMWELLANDRLFVANNEINTLRKIRDCQIPSLRKINPNIHTELERIVQKSLARDRNLRYQTAAALHRDLNRFLNRQYPDFSAQDFSVFIKSVFADEILSLRKRLVEYAKVNLSINLDIPKFVDDKTDLLNTNTNSLVVTDSGLPADSDLNSPVNLRNTGETAATTQTGDNDSSLELSKISQSGPKGFVPVPSRQQQPNPTRPDVAGDKTEPIAKLPAAAPKEPTNSGIFLDEAALAQSIQSESVRTARPKIQPIDSRPETQQNLETEEVSSPSIRTRNPRMHRGTNTRIPLPKVEGGGSMRVATFVVFALFCVSIYAYLVKFNTEIMRPVMVMTDPILCDFHKALGVECGIDRTVAHDPNLKHTPTPSQPQTQPQPPSTPGSGFEDPNGPTQQQPPINPPAQNPPAQTGLVVTSNPSGAEIYLNGRNTGLVTPTRIEVSPDETFSISIRKRGYLEFRRNDVTRDGVGHRVDANLQKLNIAYLDVEIFPPQEAVLIVNGRTINLHRNVATGITIPGATNVKVRAESKTGSSFDEIVVNVPTDKKKAIQLNPRKNARVPANK